MTRRSLIVLAAAGSALLLAGAFLFQAIGYAPCEMCLWQRWPHVGAVVLGVIGFFMPNRLIAALGALSAIVAAGLGAFHAGVEQKWWEGPSACTGDGAGLSGLSGGDLLSTDLAAPVVMCDQIAWSLLGISMAGWNAVLSTVLVAIWIAAILRRA